MNDYDDLEILFSIYPIEYTTKTIYFMFKLIDFLFFGKYLLILNLMSATCFKEVGAGATEAERTPACNNPQVIRLIETRVSVMKGSIS